MAEQLPYSNDDDLLEIRSNIASLGIAEWGLTHCKARDIINRDIEAGWYRQTCDIEGVDYRVTPFEPERMLSWSTQIKDLSVFKVLELAYEYLSKDMEDDVFLQLSDRYAKKYNGELKRVVGAGIDYDWNDDDVIDSEELSYQRLTRRLSRV